MPVISFTDLFTFTRTSSGARYNASGVIETITSNARRMDHDPATLLPLGLLIEEARTNYQLRNCAFADAYYSATNLVVTSNAAVAPDGTTTADLIAENSVNGGHDFGKYGIASVVTTDKNSVSLFIKRASGTRYPQIQIQSDSNAEQWTFDLENLAAAKTFGNSFGFTVTVIPLVNGWYRLLMEGGQAASGSTYGWFFRTCSNYAGNTSYQGDGASGFYLWEGQIEPGAFATTGITTDASQVTRSADNALITGSDFSDWFTATEGTFVVTARTPASGTRPILSIDNDSTNEQILLRTVGTALYLTVIDGGVTVADINAGTISANTDFTAAFRYKANDIAISLNGAAAVPDTSATLPTVDRARVGSDKAGNYQCGHIATLRHYPAALTDAYLEDFAA